MAIARGVMDQINNGITTHLKAGVMHAMIHARDVAKERAREAWQRPWKSRQIDSFFERTARDWGEFVGYRLSRARPDTFSSLFQASCSARSRPSS